MEVLLLSLIIITTIWYSYSWLNLNHKLCWFMFDIVNHLSGNKILQAYVMSETFTDLANVPSSML